VLFFSVRRFLYDINIFRFWCIGKDVPESVLQEQSEWISFMIIANRQHENTEYRIEIIIDGESVGDTYPITMDHEEKWE